MSCKDLFTDVDVVDENSRLVIEGGSCVNPELAFVKNTRVYHDTTHSLNVYIDEALESKNILMFYSYTIFDSEDPVRPIKTSVKTMRAQKGKLVKNELILHKVEL